MTDFDTLLHGLGEPIAPDPVFTARLTEAFVAAAREAFPALSPGVLRSTTPEHPPVRWRRIAAVAAAAVAAAAVALGVATLRGDTDTSPLPPASGEPTPTPVPSPNPSASPVPRGWGRPVPAPRAVRDWTADAWSGTEWFFWGGRDDCSGCQGAPIATGAAFDPATGRWRSIPAAPAAGYAAAAVWTGTELLVYGGQGADGHAIAPMAYDPVANSWRTLPTAPIKVRANTYGSQVAWTGSELIVWGGEPTGDGFARDTSQPDTGAAYSPATNKWRLLPKAPVTSFRKQYAIVWTGSEVLVCCGSTQDGAAYNPATDHWRRIANPIVKTIRVASYGWTGRELVVYGGLVVDSGRAGNSETALDGVAAAYDPSSDSWRPLATSPLEPRLMPAFAAGDGRFFVWGGQVFDPAKQYRDGAVYDAATDAWSRLPPLGGAGDDERGARAVWTGAEFLLLTTSRSGPPRSYEVIAYRP